jgi:hypothetical protein
MLPIFMLMADIIFNGFHETRDYVMVGDSPANHDNQNNHSSLSNEFVFCHTCGIIIINFIIPTTFLTHCVRFSIQIQTNVIIFFINSIYNIIPLVMFRCDSISLDHHQ